MEDNTKKELKDADTCTAIGAGIGAAGTGAAIITGATCPVCWIAAPALIGIGLAKRLKLKKNAACCSSPVKEKKN